MRSGLFFSRSPTSSRWNLTLATLFQALSREDSGVSNAPIQKAHWGHLVNHTSSQSFFVKGRAVALIALCEVMTLSLWFSATAVLPALKLEAHLDAFHSSLFTSLVAVGFVFGTLASALLGLADRLEPRHFFRASAWAGALANLGLLMFSPSSTAVLVCRFTTGVCMAGVYPVGMKTIGSIAASRRTVEKPSVNQP